MSHNICTIVGVGPGVGMAVAKRFGQAGFQLALVARRAEALANYEAELREAGVAAAIYPANAADFDSLHNAFAQIRQTLGDPSVLVYNPAVIKPGPPAELDPETLISDFRVNVAGALICAQEVIPAMKTQKQGTILFTGGGLALNPYPQYSSLAVGKAGLRNLTYSLGAELEPDGIQVATVTIAGFVQPGTHFDPDLIAEQYWTLHSQTRHEREIVYK